MQVSAYCSSDIRVSAKHYEPDCGADDLCWLELDAEEGNCRIVMHHLTPNRIRDLAQKLIQAALQVRGEPQCPPNLSN